MLKNDIVAVVVTYNRKVLLNKCIKSLKAQTYPLDILIIDNASTDGTADMFKKDMERTIYYNTGANIGGAGGFNVGIKIAAKLGYNYYWLMDDDTIPQIDSLEKLVWADRYLNGDYGFLASNVLWKDGSICIMNRQKYYNKIIIPNKYENTIIPVTQASFVSIFLNKKTVEEVGLPIKEFFIWGDDVEYTRRISIINRCRSFMVKNSEVIHLMGENRGSNISVDIPERIERYRYAFRNEFYTYQEAGIRGLAYYFAKCIFNLIRIMIKSPDYKTERAKILIKAVVAGSKFKPEIEKI